MWLSNLFGTYITRNGKFYCHIGPPKTGTTAIQSALQRATGKKVCYLGTFQPRALNEAGGIYSRLMNFVSTDADTKSLLMTHTEIDFMLKSGTNVILSDEMFLVNQGGIDFERKLLRLNHAVACFPCTIVISIREPIAAIKLLYLEIYYRQAVLPKVSFEQFLLSNQVRVYDYPYLLTTLKKFGFNNVKFVAVQKGQNSINLANITGSRGHSQILPFEDMNQTESTFLKKVDLLAVPENFLKHYSSGYEQVSHLIQNF